MMQGNPNRAALSRAINNMGSASTQKDAAPPAPTPPDVGGAPALDTNAVPPVGNDGLTRTSPEMQAIQEKLMGQGMQTGMKPTAMPVPVSDKTTNLFQGAPRLY